MMSEEQPPEQVPDARAVVQRRWWAAGIAALVTLVVITVAVLASGGDDGSEDAGASVPTGPDATSTASSDVSVSAVTDPTGSTGPTDVAPTSSSPTGSTIDAPASSVPGTPTTLVGETTVPGVTVPFIPGSLDTVPVETVVTAPPVAIDEEADAGTGMTFRLETLEAVKGEATGPGEIAGPAVRVTVIATNDSPSPVLVEGVVVDLTYGPDATSAAPLSGPGVVRFAGEVAPGASATGVYVFDVPVDQRGAVKVLVSYLASVSPVVFEGPAPAA
jgi:hypothetical protein